jgi:thiamine biosynthesis lipoprotein
MTEAHVVTARETTIHYREEVMGTIVTFDFYDDGGISPERVLAFLSRAVATLHEADKIFSTWKADSPLNRLRRGEIELGETPQVVLEVLEACKFARDLSGGWFDPWALPGGVDPTGYVKGWAAQRALEELVPAEVGGVMVNAAGDIASFGGPSYGTPFKVGIVNPAAPNSLVCSVELVGAIATSGAYERGDHLVNPFTGRHETKFASASVTGPDLGLSDALATALVVGGQEVLDCIEGFKEYEAMAIGHDGQMVWTTQFPFGAGVATKS